MSKNKKALSTIPQLNLKGEDYFHEVPEHVTITAFVQWKKKDLARDEISDVKMFEKKNGELAFVNRANPKICYRYSLKEIKTVYLVLG